MRKYRPILGAFVLLVPLLLAGVCMTQLFGRPSELLANASPPWNVPVVPMQMNTPTPVGSTCASSPRIAVKMVADDGTTYCISADPNQQEPLLIQVRPSKITVTSGYLASVTFSPNTFEQFTCNGDVGPSYLPDNDMTVVQVQVIQNTFLYSCS